ncbi:MAG: cytidine deaminase [Phycisphaerales bacterium JB039]
MDRELQDKLLQAARDAAARAHCPYTKFRVGAAVLTRSDKIYSGCNVENAAPPLTICAARVAVFNAVLGGDPDILTVVIYTPTKSPTPPCGACRQVINEFAAEAQIYCLCDSPQFLHRPLSGLLPDAFGPHML